MRYFRFATTTLVYLLLTFQFSAQQSDMPITAQSEEALSYFMEGRYRFENIQYATAAALFDEAILTDPGFAMAYLYRARCGGGYNVVRENLSKAEALIDLVTEGEKHFIMFHKALEESDHLAQKDHIRKLLDLYPKDKRIHYYAGIHYDYIVDIPTALMHYLKAVQIDYEYAAAYNKIGYDFIDLGFLEAAEEAFKKYITLMPDNPNPYDSYAELLMKQGQYEESIHQYQTAYQKDVLFTQALAGIGNNYIFLGEYEKARDYYHRQHEKATRINEKLDALLWIAVSYIHENNIDEAVNTLVLRATFAENASLTPDIIDTYNLIGLLLTENNQFERAEKYYNKADEMIKIMRMSSSSEQAYMVESEINNCFWLVKSGKLKEAKEQLSNCDAVVKDRLILSERKRINLVTGIYYLENNQPEIAITKFNEADTENPHTWYYMAMAFDALGYEENAGAYLDRIKYWNQNSFDYALVRNKIKM
ncbi:MAG: hypothetical protein JW995_05885 [Melioribacteraceae bacterium]|nr:hypothetical protein [Melioribacteraceae bacterium]